MNYARISVYIAVIALIGGGIGAYANIRSELADLNRGQIDMNTHMAHIDDTLLAMQFDRKKEANRADILPHVVLP